MILGGWHAPNARGRVRFPISVVVALFALAAFDHVKAACDSALSESLISKRLFVQSEQKALDDQVEAIKGQLDIEQCLKLVSDLAKVAGSLAAAFS